jgi:hypothetical protein
MKLYSLLLLFSLPFLTLKGDDPIDYLGVKGPLKFNKNVFELAWSAKPNESSFVQEYLPKGETVDHFNEMLTLNLFITNLTVEDAIRMRVSDLNNNKSIKASNVSVTENPDGNEKMVDCTITAGNVAEFVIYRFKQIDLPNDRKGLIVFSYSKRNYGDTVEKFITDLKTERITLLNTMIATEMPKVTIKSK